MAPSRALNNFEARASCNTLPSKTEQLSYRMQYAMVPTMTATQQQPSEAFTIVLSTRQQPSDPLEMLLRATLQLLGCGNLPPDARATARAAVAKALKIYYDNPTDVVKKQLSFRRARQHDRRYLTDVAKAFSALRIDEDQDRLCGAKRILPPWYRTRPQQFVTRSRRETAGIDAVVAKRPPCPVGRTGALEAREACRAQFVLRTGRPRDCTPAPCRRS